MKKTFFALMGLIVSFNVLAENVVILKPTRPLDCSIEENDSQYAHRIIDAYVGTNNKSVTIKLIWEIGKCETILEGNGHAAKFINSATIYRSNGEGEIAGLSVKSKKALDNSEVITTIKFDKTELKNNEQFDVYFTYGLYMAVAKWKMSIQEVGNNNFQLRLFR